MAEILGDDFNNDLNGTDNDDIIEGLGGDDTIRGKSGNDLIGGGLGDDKLNGGLGNDTIFGGAGNDILDAGVAGSDLLFGGAGNDQYVVTGSNDKVFESVGGGIDTVKSGNNYTLSNNVENLVLTGDSNSFGIGNSLDNRITGNKGNNTLRGEAGNDTLLGGSGNDRLTGTNTVVAGVGERDILTSGSGLDRDRFVLGEFGKVHYLDPGTAPNSGNTSFARISDFDIVSSPGEPTTQVDVIQLEGKASDYKLGATTVSGQTGVGIFNSLDDDLIGLVQGSGVNTSTLSLTNSTQFDFV